MEVQLNKNKGDGGMSKEMVNHPDHYQSGKIEVIEVIEEFNLGFCLGNTIKYILRHENKAKPLEDLKKAKWYLERHINQLACEDLEA